MVSMMDNSIKCLFAENFKEKVSFYGHALPIVDFDISNDDYVLASISADKSIRVWDTKFGNCRRIINKAHDKGVYQIRIL